MRKIKNFEQLAVNDARRAVLEIAEAGFSAVDTKAAIRRALIDIQRIYFFVLH